MDFMEKLKSLLGINTYRENRDLPPYDSRTYNATPEYTPRSFDVFTNPLQMQQFFEQQMNEILRSFGFQEFDNGSGVIGSFNMPSIEGSFGIDGDNGFFGSFNVPSIEDNIAQESQQGNLREHFLKKGYEVPSSQQSDYVDKDLDGKLNIGDLGAILDNKSETVPNQMPKHGNFFFGQSLSSKTVTNPNGCIETHRTVRDSQGNEETTITKRLGDKEYTVIKKREKSGKEEIIENLINMTEADKNIFVHLPDNIPRLENRPLNGFPFDKFFK